MARQGSSHQCRMWSRSRAEKLQEEKYDNDSMGWQEVVEEEERSFGR